MHLSVVIAGAACSDMLDMLRCPARPVSPRGPEKPCIVERVFASCSRFLAAAVPDEGSLITCLVRLGTKEVLTRMRNLLGWLRLGWLEIRVK